MKKQLRFDTTYNSYTSISVIGHGGSGIVYEVRDEDSKVYALKLLAENNVNSEKLRRFKNEIHFCTKNNHKNILTVIDDGFQFSTDRVKRPFYVMPRFEKTLRDLMNAKIPSDKVLPLFSQILDGVEAAHYQGVWHRDLKPENILYDQVSNVCVIADFGIAHFNESNLITQVKTKPSSKLANFQYAAPEQRKKEGLVDYKADIFALGLILNEMFTDEVLHGVGHKKIAVTTPQFSYLDELVEAMVQQSPRARPDSIENIKLQLIARGNEFIERQRMDALRNTVIPSIEINDPTPVTLIDRDYIDDHLVFMLNQHVSSGWIESFKNVWEPNGLGGAMPIDYNFRLNQARLSCEGENAHILQSKQLVIDRFKEYLRQANEKYKQQQKSEVRYRESQMKLQLQEQLKKEEKRQQILRELKI